MADLNFEKYINARKTPQMIAILNYLKSSPSHPTANDVYNAVKKETPNISLTTVYNNLKRLSDNKVIQELYIKNGPSRFDKNPSTHYHMICNQCGQIEDLSYPLLKEIEEFAENLYKFSVLKHEFNLYGCCSKCQ